jgi:membrane-associated phospholipid phosphatase
MQPSISSRLTPRPQVERSAGRFLLRRSEQALLLYFAYASIMGLWLGVRSVSLAQLLAINVVLALGFLALSRVPLAIEWRDFVPYPLGLLCYREAGWLASAVRPHDLEHRWIVWDRFFLDGLHARAAIESLGSLIPSILEAAYLSVYIIGPFAVLVLYILRRRDLVDRLWLAFLVGLMLSYIQFPFWPSEPPRTVFPDLDLPTFLTPLRRLNLFLVGNYGIHSSVFPSAHVSGAVAGALMLRRILPGRRWIGNLFLLLAALIALATVYGRYHYLVDALAGAAVGVLAYRVTQALACKSGFGEVGCSPPE